MLTNKDREKLKKVRDEGIPDDGKLVCGYWIFSSSESDPFNHCCVIHDKEYLKKEQGTQPKSRKQVDREFLRCMQVKAGDSKWLNFKAKTYYSIVRTFGSLFWNH